MVLSNEAKERLRREIVSLLTQFPEVRRVVIFGSFITSSEPHDLDVAVFQDSDEDYYSLAMKYRRSLRSVANQFHWVLPHRGEVLSSRRFANIWTRARCCMNDETRLWLSYADENLEVADLVLAHGHFNFSTI